MAQNISSSSFFQEENNKGYGNQLSFEGIEKKRTRLLNGWRKGDHLQSTFAGCFDCQKGIPIMDRK